MKKNWCLIFISFTLFNCQGQKEKFYDSEVVSEEIIPFEYDEKMLKLILFEGAFNDTIPITVFYDSAYPSNLIAGFMPNKWEVILGESARLQIGNREQVVNIEYVENFPLFEILSDSSVCIGNHFFEDKIIEISYQNKQIRIIEDIKELIGYTRIEARELNGFFFIPVQVFIGNKMIEESTIVDTGNNGYISFNRIIREKYNIEPDESVYHGGTLSSQGKLSSFSILADSIKIGGLSIPDIRASFSSEPKNIYRPDALLGNSILEHFTIVFDLMNNDFYIRPNNQ